MPAQIQSGRCVCLYVRTSPNTIRQLWVCLFGRAPIQSGRWLFVCPEVPAPSDSVCSSPIALSYSCIAAVPGTLLSGLFVCPAELPYNQADVGLFVRQSCNTIRQMLVCLSGRAAIQSGRCLFVCPDELQYNQAQEDSNPWREVY